MSSQINRVLEILLYFNIKEELSISSLRTNQYHEFFSKFRKFLSNCGNQNDIQSIDLDCLTLLICELSSPFHADYIKENVISEFISLVSLFKVSGKSLCLLFDTLRIGALALSSFPPFTYTGESEEMHMIPLRYHAKIMKVINECVEKDNPPCISLPGSKESFIQLSSIPLTCSRAFTMSIWLKIPSEAINKGFVLFRCRSPSSGLDAIVSSIIDNVMTLTIRTTSEGKGKDEASGKIYLTSNEWHLISVTQSVSSTGETADRVAVYVDENLEMEKEVKYPFALSSNQPFPKESLWIFGLGFNGLIASITMYSEEFTLFMIKLLHSLGPIIPDISIGVTCPQSSFDSGHHILGSLIAKGPAANRAAKMQSLFCIKPIHFEKDVQLPQIIPGKVYPEHIEMVPRVLEFESMLTVSMHGECKAVTQQVNAWIDAWMESGGCATALYLLWSYCVLKSSNKSSDGSSEEVGNRSETNQLVKLNSTSPSDSEVMACIKENVTLLSKLIKSTADLKEQFIQIHGFHVMGYCFAQVSSDCKRSCINEGLVKLFFSLLKSLQLDGLKGDGLTAALQGLLFDFRIWGLTTMSTVCALIDNLCDSMMEIGGDQLYRSIGIQRILDIFRLYIIRPVSYQPNVDGENSDGGQSSLVECADAVQRLLIFVMDAARAFAARQKSNSLVIDCEIILNCLEETNHGLVAERLLRVVSNLCLTAPTALIQAMINLRYHETIVLSLMSKKGYPIKVRAMALTHMFWLFTEEMRELPLQILELRRTFNHFTSSLWGGMALMALNYVASNNNVSSRNRNLTAADNSRLKTLSSQIRDAVKPLEKTWLTITMIAEVISRALDDGVWGSPLHSSVAKCSMNFNSSNSNFPSTSSLATSLIPSQDSSNGVEINEMINIFIHNLNAIDAWMMMPLLPTLLSRSDLQTSQHILMTLNVLLKSDESQCEVLACMPDRSWIRQMVLLACIGEVAYLEASRLDIIHSSNRSSFVVDDNHTSLHNEVHEEDEELKVRKWSASTCTELSLDSLSIVMEYKTRCHHTDSWSTWNCLQNCLKTGCRSQFGKDHCDIIEAKFLKRCLSLVFQRLSKNSEGWTADVITSVTNVLTFVEIRKLCGEGSSKDRMKTNAPSNQPLLIDFDHPTDGSTTNLQTVEEMQIMCFIMDLMTNIRRSSDNGALQGMEWKVLKLGLRLVLSCLKILNEAMADRIANEIMNCLGYMIESWAPLSGEDFKQFVVFIINNLRECILDDTLPTYLHNRYSKLVHLIVQFFKAIEHSLALGGKASKHVLPTLEIFSSLDISIKDPLVAFQLLDIAMRSADPISFDEQTTESRDGAIPSDILAQNYYTDFSRDQFKVFNEDDDHHGTRNSTTKLSKERSNGDVFSTLPDAEEEITQSARAGAAADPSDELLLSFEADDVPTEKIPKVLTLCSPSSHDIVSEMITAVATPVNSSNTSESNLVEFHDFSSPEYGTQYVTSLAFSHQSTDSKAAGHELIVPETPKSPGKAEDEKNREQSFQHWLKVRQGITVDRVDSERARLARSMDALDISSEATDKFWKKTRRKVESEFFLQSHRCQWKLGVSHEGHFPGRKRIVLRPRFDNDYSIYIPAVLVDEMSMKESSIQSEEENIALNSSLKSISAELMMSPDGKSNSSQTDEISRALAKACAGYIQDVTRNDYADSGVGSAVTVETEKGPMLPDSLHDGILTTGIPGSGWGLVDADGSEEGGFGVVGLASIVDHSAHGLEDHGRAPTNNQSSVPNASTQPELFGIPLNQNDMMGDIRQVEENYRQGKGVDAGPCHSGTRRVGSGAVVLEAKVIMITASGNFWGNFSFNGKEIFFSSIIQGEDGQKEDNAAVNLVKKKRMRRRRWVLSSVSAIYLRRFRLRDTAIEVFFRRGKHRNVFVDFGHTKENAKQRNDFAKALMNTAPATAFKQSLNMSALRLVYEHGVQEKWLSGKLSNFEYLMALNTISGRSYNDLCQYPIMPWIITDYTSQSLDLNNPATYRDLSKPMGALNPERLNEFMERFYSFEENVSSGIPPFMYGSHYSTMVGVVLHFLVRLQPFAALHKEMQNGHFDVPDRLFSSIPRAFRHNTTQLSEVKELIPEFFTTPEMFRNLNRFDLGTTQDGELIDDVELPPWASSPEDFVRIHREALESDYVSENLHEWIDLIFGYKQRGPDAVDAHNVFYYLTYYGSVDRYMIGDEALRKATELQIAHFGQVPMQLFRAPHPAKKASLTSNTLPLPRPLKKCFTMNTNQNLIELSNPSLTVSPLSDATSPASVENNVPYKFSELPSNTFDILDLSYGMPVIGDDRGGLLDHTSHPISDTNRSIRSDSVSSQSDPAGWMTAAACDEEQIALEAPTTALLKSPGNTILSVYVTTDRIVCIMDNGVVQVLKYSASEEAKAALIIRANLKKAEPNSNTSTRSATTTSNPKQGAVSSKLPIDLLNFDDPSPNDVGSGNRKGSTIGNVVSAASNSLRKPSPETRSLFSKTAESNVKTTTSRKKVTSTTSSVKGMENPLSNRILARGDPLVLLEKELHFFELIPRILLVKHDSFQQKNIKKSDEKLDLLEKLCKGRPRPISDEFSFEAAALSINFTKVGNLVISSGYPDGRITIRELDLRNGNIKFAGDFRAHKKPVVSFATDNIPYGNTDVIVSCDSSGHVIIWTISKVRSNVSVNYSYVISRRPQRLFRCQPHSDMCCDISWQMGIVIVVSGNAVNIFSIERDELLKSFSIDVNSLISSHPVPRNSITAISSQVEEIGLLLTAEVTNDAASEKVRRYLEFSHRGPSHSPMNVYMDNLSSAPSDKSSAGSPLRPPITFSRRIAVCDSGVIAIHLEVFKYQDTLLDFEDHVIHQHMLLSYTLSGQRCGHQIAKSPITFLSCPDRGDIVVTGHVDGSVVFYRTQDLIILHSFKPYTKSILAHITIPSPITENKDHSFGKSSVRSMASRGSVYSSMTGSTATAATPSNSSVSTSSANAGEKVHRNPSPIINISFGPIRSAPAVVCITTESGLLYVKAFPDFIKWERNRSQSTFAQLASAPLQAVKQQAQHISMWTSEAAGVIAQNAKSFADEAMEEIKKMNKNKLVKGVVNFFGMGSRASESDETK